MWNFFSKPTTSSSGNSRNKASDEHFREVGELFQQLEQSYFAWGGRYEVTDISPLSANIELGEKILDLVTLYNLGNSGIIQSQTVLYLAQSYSVRGHYYFFQRIRSQGEDKVQFCRRAVDDYCNAERHAKKWDMPLDTTLILDRRCLCYLWLGMYDAALTDALLLCEIYRSPHSYQTLSYCYSTIRDYPKAIEAATEAVKLSNDYLRPEMLRSRGHIYREKGDSYLAELDLREADELDTKYRNRQV